jgi:asparagine synthase (glutamine-hydrolysing)
MTAGKASAKERAGTHLDRCSNEVVHIGSGRGWRFRDVAGCRIHSVGHPAALERLVNLFTAFSASSDLSSDIEAVLKSFDGFSAAILEFQDRRVFAFVDHCRSYPVYYRIKPRAAISNDARLLLQTAGGLNTLDDSALNAGGILEFAMSGYVYGDATTVTGIHQLRAGEWLLIDPKSDEILRKRFYRYTLAIKKNSIDVWKRRLNEVLDSCVRRAASRSAGRPIYVALSGGLDSRVILSKLHEIGYRNLYAFSYGAKGTYETKAARTVAKRLGIPWHFEPITNASARAFFASERRKEFWHYSDGLSVIPNTQDLNPLCALLDRGELPDDAVIINGQSGDFISGGHIARPLLSLAPGERSDGSDTVESAIHKHYALWSNLMTSKNVSTMGKLIQEEMELGEMGDDYERDDLVGRYERWEYEGRQCQYVIHGQRVYDFLGLSWELPLWDIELVQFFSTVPVELKRDQTLYKAALSDWDYKGLFANFQPNIWRWPGASIAIVPFARVVGLLFGRRAKKHVYGYARYLDHYRYFYAPYGLRHFLRYQRQIRHALALNVQTWMQENNVPRDMVNFDRVSRDD